MAGIWLPQHLRGQPQGSVDIAPQWRDDIAWLIHGGSGLDLVSRLTAGQASPTSLIAGTDPYQWSGRGQGPAGRHLSAYQGAGIANNIFSRWRHNPGHNFATGDFSVLVLASNPAEALSGNFLTNHGGNGQWRFQTNYLANGTSGGAVSSGALSFMTYGDAAFMSVGSAGMVDGTPHAYLFVRRGTTHELWRDGALITTQTGTARNVTGSKTVGPAMYWHLNGLDTFTGGGVYSGNSRLYMSAAWRRAVDGRVSADPWSTFAPRRVWVPVSAGGGTTPTLATSLTAAVQLARAATAGATVAVQHQRTASATAAAAVQAAGSAQASLQAAVQQALAATAALQVAVQRDAAASAQLGAAVRLARGATSALDLAVQAQHAVTAGLTAQVQGGGVAVASLDAYIQAGSSVSASASAAVLASALATAGLGAGVRIDCTASAGVTAALQRAQDASAALQAAVQHMRSVGAALSAQVQGGAAIGADVGAAVRHLASAAAGVQAAVAVSAAASLGLGAAVSLQRSVSAAMAAAVLARVTAAAALSAYVQDPSILVAATWGFIVPSSARSFVVAPTARTFKVPS